MSEENLRRLMARLDTELKETKITDKETLENLTRLKKDIDRKLHARTSADRKPSPSGGIRELALRIEARHPSLTNLLNEISDSLSSLGI